MARSNGSEIRPASELATRLEHTFRLLGRRIYLLSVRKLRVANRGLDNASVPLLARLEDRDDVRPSDLAVALELDQSTVSRQLRQLEDLGLVVRRADNEDGRASRISLTVKGRESLSGVRAARSAMLDEVFNDWSDADRRQLLTLLDRLRAGLEALPASGSSSPNRENRA